MFAVSRARKTRWPTFVKRPTTECRPREDTALPNELRTELSDARSSRIRDISEAAAANVPARIHELRVVEDVEEFGTNLERHGFLNGNYLRDSKVGVVEARTMEESPIRCPEKAAIRTSQNPRHISALGSGKCALVEICERAGSGAGIIFVNRTHEIGHIG